MKTITKSKECKSITQAERYQNRLYNRFDSVKLVIFPRFSESGLYVWNCESPNSPCSKPGTAFGKALYQRGSVL